MIRISVFCSDRVDLCDLAVRLDLVREGMAAILGGLVDESSQRYTDVGE